MSAELEKKGPVKTTGKGYASVQEMMQGLQLNSALQKKVSELEKETHLTQMLTGVRQQSGLTQEQMAAKLGVTQGAVSKLESGRDDDLTIAEIRKYSEVTGQRIGLLFGKPLNHVEAVKLHSLAIKRHLTALTEIAHQDEDFEKEIQAFFGEAFFNILNIMSKCQQQMPNGKDSVQVRFELIDGPKPKRKAERAELTPVG